MSTPRSADPAALAALSNLDDPLRRRLYEFVSESEAPDSREQAAAAVEVGRTLAAYHLDKLADADLVTVSYQRPAGRGGPGAGRPAKFYTRSVKELSLSVPPRDYELLARLLVSSVEQDIIGVVREAVAEAAFDAGRRAAEDAGGNLLAALRGCGYLPHTGDDDRINLRNCPFHLVARDHLDVVCGLNLRLVEGAIAASTQHDAHAELEPRPDRCCVVIHHASSAHAHSPPDQAPPLP
jgi:predicted ArsR family transcriptional regulator